MPAIPVPPRMLGSLDECIIRMPAFSGKIYRGRGTDDCESGVGADGLVTGDPANL